MTETLLRCGTLRGHTDWVTQIVTNPNYEHMIFSSSRDKSLILWELIQDDFNYGIAKKRFHGHSHYITDVVLSSDGNYAISGSWDKTLRLWDLAAGRSTRHFKDHTNDVLSVAFSPDNRQIISGSRDHTIKLWNTLGECKFTLSLNQDGHSDWVSCVRFSPKLAQTTVVSAGWDKVVKVWNLNNCRLMANYHGHTAYLNNVAISPDGSLCTSGGRDGKAMLWDLNENKHLHSLEHSGIIQAMCFSPNRYWLCTAHGPAIKIWDLETKEMIDELYPEFTSNPQKSISRPPNCLSLAWSSDGQTLFAGYTDNIIRVWQVCVYA